MTVEQYSNIISHLTRLSEKLDNIESKFKLPDAEIAGKKLYPKTGIKSLAEILEVEEDKIYNFIHFTEDNQFSFLFDIIGKSETEKQLKATLCMLTVSNYLNGINNILSKELIKKLESMKIKSLDHISHTLKKYKKYIVTNGKPSSPNFSYTITHPGLSEGTRIFKEMIK